MRKIKKFTVEEDSLVYAVSFVERPAIESEFVYFSEEKPRQILLEQEEKHLVYGAALVPDFPIYRRNGSNEYYIEFSKESIEHLAHNYLKDGYNYSFTLQHEKEVDDISIIESWIKMSENDKSVDLGLDVPNGTWVIGVKVNNDEVWNEIKSGNARGFSVESLLNLDEIDFSKEEDKMEDNKSLLEQIKQIVLEALGKNETVEETIENTIVEEQTEEVIETEVTNETVEVSEETETVEEEVVETTAEEETVEEVVEEAVALESVVAELNAQIETLNDEIEELKKENAKLSKQPSVKPIKANMSEDHRSPFDRMMAVMQANRK